MAVPAGAPTSKRQASAPGAYEVEIGGDAKLPQVPIGDSRKPTPPLETAARSSRV
jgi:hypothetical protein